MSIRSQAARRWRSAVFTVSVAFSAACIGADDSAGNDAQSNGGHAGTVPSDPGGAAAAAGAGGVSMASGGVGGWGVGGVGGVGGEIINAGSGGAGGGEMMPSGGQSGGGGMGSGGTGGSAPIVDAGEPPSEATPSAGCNGTAARPAGGVVTVAQSHYLAFPESYDGTKPYPVLIGFHGCGGVNRGTNAGDTEWMRLTDGSSFASEYVRVVPLSADGGGCWSYDTDIARIKRIYDDLLVDHCIDTSRVFATGHSSGAQMIVQILLQSHVADAEHLGFDAVAPVAASDYGPLGSAIPVMYIQGMMDAERGNGDGHETVERFRAANGCGDGSVPYVEVAGCQSGATAVNPGCIAYEGCAAPTLWCSHNDPAYGGTMHGVPCFAVRAMHDFFESIP